MGNRDELPKEKCLKGIAKLLPTLVTSQKKKKGAGVPGGNVVLELVVYQQRHLAHLYPRVSVKSGKGR